MPRPAAPINQYTNRRPHGRRSSPSVGARTVDHNRCSAAANRATPSQTITERPVKVSLPGPYLLTRTMWMECRSERAYTDREDAARVKGPTGMGVRLFSEFVLRRSEGP